jgi:sugar lactone lactonase YvrE
MAMKTLITTGVALAVVLSAELIAQAPPPCTAAGDIQFICGQQGPEDLVVVPGSQWVVASAYGGSGGINLVRVSDRRSIVAFPSDGEKVRFDSKAYVGCSGPPDRSSKAKFLTHGLSLQAGKKSVHRLFVVAHGARESIEVFELDTAPATPVLTWIGCVVAPDPIGLNSVRWLPDGGFIATDFLARNISADSRAKMLTGEKNGALWEWHANTGWVKVPGSEAAGANGIEISEDGKTLYVAAWGSQSFFRLSRGQTAPKRDEVPLGFRVDNIRWAKDGSILASGQGGTAPGEQTTTVVKIDPKTLMITPVLKRPNVDAFGGGTVAVEIGKDLWVGSFRGDRIAVFPVGK